MLSMQLTCHERFLNLCGIIAAPSSTIEAQGFVLRLPSWAYRGLPLPTMWQRFFLSLFAVGRASETMHVVDLAQATKPRETHVRAFEMFGKRLLSRVAARSR